MITGSAKARITDEYSQDFQRFADAKLLLMKRWLLKMVPKCIVNNDCRKVYIHCLQSKVMVDVEGMERLRV